MDNISISPEIKLITSSIRSFHEKPDRNKLFPFIRVRVTINDVYHCPFCGKEINHFHCSCEDFTKKLDEIKDTFMDKEHKSRLHHKEHASILGYDKSIKDELSLRSLSKNEIYDLGPDFWDFAQRFSDSIAQTAYMVGNANYDGDKVTFFVKDPQTKAVYQCSLDGIEHSHLQVFLGYYRQKTISHGGNTLGNYHFEHYWENIAEFQDWDAFCKMLKSV